MNAAYPINEHGSVLESQIHTLLVSKKYAQTITRFADFGDFPWFVPQHRQFKTPYHSQMRLDFLLYHPQKWPRGLAIECKWQSSPGTVDEKFPYLVLGMRGIPIPGVILLAGGGYRDGALAWLMQQETDDLIIIESLDRIVRWANAQL